MERTAEPDLTQKIDAIDQNEREQRAGLGQNHPEDRPDDGQQSVKEHERLNPGQQTGGTGGAGARPSPAKPD